MEKELLIKFANGSCTTDESKRVIAWLDKPGNGQLIEKMIEGDLLDAFNDAYIEQKDMGHLLRQIPLDATEYDPYSQAPKHYGGDENSKEVLTIQRKQRSIGLWLKVAASLIIIGMLSFMVWNMRDSGRDEVAYTKEVKENTQGRKSIIYLQDGSIVHLNSDSKISYVKPFSDTLRAIELEGEAYFEVTKDNSRPFVVYTGDIAVTALGTAFNVKNYDDESQICVALQSGRVLVTDYKTNTIESKKLFLDPGTEVRYSKSNRVFTDIEMADLKESFGWKDGVIYFKHADFNTVLERLERWYGVQFDVKNSPQYKWSYTAEFKDQTLQDVLKSIGFSQNFTCTINDKYVEIIFNDKQQ